MATIDDNRRTWGDLYEWADGGDVWSSAWGGPEMQWFGTLLPRLHCFLPAPTILEIAPGFGRWTQFLKDHCRRLIAVDVTERCVEHCQVRFKSSPHVECHVNDGKSLDMVTADSIDFAVSFDSLVHVEEDVIDGYLAEMARVLGPNAITIIHHSNKGSYPDLDNPHHRAPSMTAQKFAAFADNHGLSCVGQELIDWGGSGGLVDCISIATKPGSRWHREPRTLENDGFTEESNRISRIGAIYGPTGFPGAIEAVQPHV